MYRSTTAVFSKRHVWLLGYLLTASLLSSCASDTQADNDMVMCPQDVKQCPDGSYVSRSGPKCAFAKCP